MLLDSLPVLILLLNLDHDSRNVQPDAREFRMRGDEASPAVGAALGEACRHPDKTRRSEQEFQD